MSNKPTHICEIDCQLSITDKGKRVHMMYATSPTTAAGRYQYDKNREIYRMGKGARAAMRATGQSDTRTNREWNYGRKLFKDAADRATSEVANGRSVARADAEYRDEANAVFGPNRRPYVKRSIRAHARFREEMSKDILKSIDWEIYKHSRPAYLPQSEHDPNL